MGHYNILNVFFENPGQEFQIRGIARLLKISKTAASYHINNLVKEKLVIRSRKGIFPSYFGAETKLFKYYKASVGIEQIIKSGLVEFLEKLNPSCIILFGSFAEGEYDSKSDIDLFVLAKDTKIDLSRFEDRLGHKINIIFSEDLNSISSQLYNNIINGFKLAGFIKAR